MKLYVFRSGQEPDIFGYTGDETGANLPSDFRPWTPSGDDALTAIDANATMVTAGASGPIFAAVERDGFYIARHEQITKMTGVPKVN